MVFLSVNRSFDEVPQVAASGTAFTCGREGVAPSVLI
jgi:hypothetical protein